MTQLWKVSLIISAPIKWNEKEVKDYIESKIPFDVELVEKIKTE